MNRLVDLLATQVLEPLAVRVLGSLRSVLEYIDDTPRPMEGDEAE